MKALIQRVKRASVEVEGQIVGEIGQGILLFLGVEKHDDEQIAERMLKKILAYRIFPNEQGRMDLSLTDVGGALLVVSQFTLAANTRKGTKPSFSSAASPAQGAEIYSKFVRLAENALSEVQTGEFGADMQVSLVNDGPVTFMLEL